jgi:hypothetical protein
MGSLMASERSQFLNEVKQLGFIEEGRDSKGHIKLRHTVTGRRVAISFSPSRSRTRLNEMRRLRKAAQ